MAFLKLDNTRIEEIEDESTDWCGFKLTGYKGSFDFFCNDHQKREEWINHFRRLCVGLNISQR